MLFLLLHVALMLSTVTPTATPYGTVFMATASGYT